MLRLARLAFLLAWCASAMAESGHAQDPRLTALRGRSRVLAEPKEWIRGGPEVLVHMEAA